MMKRTISLLLAMLMLASMALTGCGEKEDTAEGKGNKDQTVQEDNAEKQDDAAKADKPYDGETIRFIFANHNWTDVIKEKLPEFTEKTGITVEIEEYPEDQLSQKISIELASRSSNLDGYMIRPLQEGKQHVLNGWTADVSDLVNDPAYDKDDVIPSMQEIFKTDDGTYYGIPLVGEREVLYYRKDLLEAKGIAVPTTMDELIDAAAKLNDPDAGISGFVARGQQSQCVTQFSSYLYAYGGDFMDADMKAAINTPEAIKAMNTYGGLLRDYGPAGTLNMTWQQASAIFSQGKAALYTDADSLYRSVMGGEGSPVEGKVGFAPMPSGPAGQKTYNVCSWGLAVASYSKKQEATKEFLKWAADIEQVKYEMSNGVPMARISAWEDKEATAGFPEELAAAIVKSNEFGVAYDRPLIISVGKAREAIGKCIQTIIEGNDVMTVVDDANAEFQAVIDEDLSGK